MEIKKVLNNDVLTVELTGRLDTTTAPELETVFKAELVNAKSLILDFTNLEYISSAGLRVLLSAKKTLAKTGDVTILNANAMIKEVFEVTGFDTMFIIK